MRLALENADCNTKDIDYVNLHGTSTVLNDRIETSALKRAFDGQASRIPGITPAAIAVLDAFIGRLSIASPSAHA